VAARRKAIKYYGFLTDSLLKTMTEGKRTNELLTGSLTPDHFPTTSMRRVMVVEAGNWSDSEGDEENTD
jgi:hypothetical protein